MSNDAIERVKIELRLISDRLAVLRQRRNKGLTREEQALNWRDCRECVGRAKALTVHA